MATKSLLGPHTSAFPKAKCAPALGCPGPGCPEEHGVCHHRGLAMSLLLRLRLGPCSLSCGYLWLFGTLPPTNHGKQTRLPWSSPSLAPKQPRPRLHPLQPPCPHRPRGPAGAQPWPRHRPHPLVQVPPPGTRLVGYVPRTDRKKEKEEGGAQGGTKRVRRAQGPLPRALV